MEENSKQLQKFIHETGDATSMDLSIGGYEFKGVVPYVDEIDSEGEVACLVIEMKIPEEY